MDYNNNEFTVKVGSKAFTYNFFKLNCEQAELAEEIGEWRKEQLVSGQLQPVNTIEKSGAFDWLFMICSHLFLEQKETVIMPYDRNKVNQIEKELKTAAITELSTLRRAVKDFFSNSGNAELASTLLFEVQNHDKTAQLFSLLIGASGKKSKTE